MQRIIQLMQNGRTYTFTVEQDGFFEFWAIDTPGRPRFPSPCMVRGSEQPGFFSWLAKHSDDPKNWP